jgi:hypothetical protein
MEWSTHLGLTTRYLLLFDSYGSVFVGRPLWREDGSVFCICYWSSSVQSFPGPRRFGLVTIFYCLRFETSIFVASYDSRGNTVEVFDPASTRVTSQSVTFNILIIFWPTTEKSPLPTASKCVHPVLCFFCCDNQPLTAFITSAINCWSARCHDIWVFTDRYLVVTIPHSFGCEVILPTALLWAM